ncbi:hypothetical protein RB653_006453 [Dictyostelium firmibasis]|uniref:Carbohydrate binding domain-containing protein n=1 Tax=Dictyostelium firmibasis TaxID=79012 RepID=A0AAN7YZ39_9MYCE
MKNIKFILILCLLITINFINADNGSSSLNHNDTSIESPVENNNTLSSSSSSTSSSSSSYSSSVDITTSLDSTSSSNITYKNYTCTENESCKSEIEVCLKIFGDDSKDKTQSIKNTNCECDCKCNKKNDTSSTSTTKRSIDSNCVPMDSLNITLLATTINSWTDGEKGNFTQFEVTIENNEDRNIKQIYIGYDDSLSLRDKSSLWNMVISESKENILILPPYQQTINTMSNYTFGYIISGTTPANLIINEIIIE